MEPNETGAMVRIHEHDGALEIENTRVMVLVMAPLMFLAFVGIGTCLIVAMFMSRYRPPSGGAYFICMGLLFIAMGAWWGFIPWKRLTRLDKAGGTITFAVRSILSQRRPRTIPLPRARKVVIGSAPLGNYWYVELLYADGGKSMVLRLIAEFKRTRFLHQARPPALRRGAADRRVSGDPFRQGRIVFQSRGGTATHVTPTGEEVGEGVLLDHPDRRAPVVRRAPSWPAPPRASRADVGRFATGSGPMTTCAAGVRPSFRPQMFGAKSWPTPRSRG
jgi:hypothetical protein